MSDTTQYYLTSLRVKELEEELKFLKEVKEPRIAQQINDSRQMEGVEDNTTFELLIDEQNSITARIREIERMLSSAILIKIKSKIKNVSIGCKVIVEVEGRKDEFHIVGVEEASPFEGKISTESPVGKSLLGCSVGQEVLVETEMYSTFYKIIDIQNGQ